MTTTTKAAALALASALASGGITATVLKGVSATAPVVVWQSERTFRAGAAYYNQTWARVLRSDGGVASEPKFEGLLSIEETVCVKAYETCVLQPRAVKATQQ